MRGDLKIRKTRTASGATVVQIIQYVRGQRHVVRHIGSAHTDEEVAILYKQAEALREQLCRQPSLFATEDSSAPRLETKDLQLDAVTHRFAYEALRRCAQQCELNFLSPLYKDLALMRIIEPTSKLRTIKLLSFYFGVSYAERTVYRLLPKLINHKKQIETAAYRTVCRHFGESFALVLYDVTTLHVQYSIIRMKQLNHMSCCVLWH